MSPRALEKIYYSIREVSEITGVEAHVLRFWEKEFSMLRPRRGRSGNRTYKDRDIEIIKKIRHLLWDQKFTIQGASEQLKIGKAGDGEEQVTQPALPFAERNDDLAKELRQTLVEIRDLMAGNTPS
ncbi:TPA: MerR family transcriptional regulator [Candidatus Latescibacteria bacterium]|nr:MerR family transcriptional regulator [Candidatus Latescibacterota bacterium]